MSKQSHQPVTLHKHARHAWDTRPHLAFAFANFDHFLEAAFVRYQRQIETRQLDELVWTRFVDERTAEAEARIRAARALSGSISGAPSVERTGQRLIVWLYGKIWDAPAIANADTICSAIDDNADAAAVVVRIASAGGRSLHADRIAAALDRHKGRTVAVVDKFAYSAATIVACACDRVLMREDASWMVHRTSVAVDGNAEKLSSAAAAMRIEDMQTERYYSTQRGIPQYRVHHAMNEAQYLSANEALAAGWVDQIIPALPIDWGTDSQEATP